MRYHGKGEARGLVFMIKLFRLFNRNTYLVHKYVWHKDLNNQGFTNIILAII